MSLIIIASVAAHAERNTIMANPSVRLFNADTVSKRMDISSFSEDLVGTSL